MKGVSVLAVIAVLCMAGSAHGWFYGGWGGYGLGLGYGYGLGLGWPYYRYFRSTMSEGDITGRIQCRYFKEKNILSCTGRTGVVECGVTSNFTGLGDEYKFELFGLGCDKTMGTDLSEEFYRYSLYPRSVDNKVWYNSTMNVEGTDVTMALFHSFTYNYYGYRVNELSCFERFNSLFKDANKDEVVSITGVTPAITVPLFGEILTETKRVVA